MSFQAKYSSRCAACDERIHDGNWVRYEDDFLVHDDCPEPVNHDAPQRNERNCPDCYMVHAGECF